MISLRSHPLVCAVGAVAIGLAFPAAATDDPPLRGFTVESSQVQREWEAKFRAIPSRDSLRSYMRRLAARPHHLGSPGGRANAEWMRDRFAAWGWDAKLEAFEVLFPTPRERVVELVAPTRFRARLEEPTVPRDPTSGQKSEQLPSYNVYSIDGDVTGPLVYVNYGVPADYERLERMGVSVKGAIVIARYGGSWRGIKPKVAAERGAIGCIIYSDPKDDGYWVGDVFPDGPMRPSGGIQRGSVADMPLYPGDPTTPGRGSVRGVERLAFDETPTLTKIPVLPISYSDAEPLLRALGGRVAPEEWRGALPLTYHVGPGPARVRLKVKSDWSVKTLYNVIARIEGSEAPDEWIVRGNHHDAWVNGAVDPVSGMVAVLEEARAIGELRKQGWRPRRTIVYAGWDGEEQGLLGSTEWVETHADELRTKVVAYLNTDSNDRGFLNVGGSHTLEAFINAVMRDVGDPETGMSVWKRAQLRRIASGDAEARRETRERRDLRIDPLGSGSDYTPFLQHLGIASLNLSFGGEGPGTSGIYHSIYDDYYWVSHFGDSSFAYGQALAQTVGTAVLRLAGAEVLPYEFRGLADAVSKYAGEVKKLLADKQDEARERNRQLEEGVFDAIRDPRAPETAPRAPEMPPYLNFAPLDNGVVRLQEAARRYEQALAAAMRERAPADAVRQRASAETTGQRTSAAPVAGGAPESASGRRAADPAWLRDVNAALIATERALTRAEGLPRRPWFRHQIYAPGFYTGYGVKTLPGIREAIERSEWREAEEQIGRVGEVLEAVARAIETAQGKLERSTRRPR